MTPSDEPFVLVPTWIYDQMPNLVIEELRVLMAICQQRQVAPEKSLAELTGIGEAKVNVWLRRLEKRGMAQRQPDNTYIVPAVWP